MHTLFLIYLTVAVTKQFTYVRSHGWVLIETLVATVLVFAVYRVYLLFDLRSWLWIIPICVLSGVLDAILLRVDGGRIISGGRMMIGGRSMIDVDADKKGMFQTDFRLVRRAAIMGLLMIWVTWRASP